MNRSTPSLEPEPNAVSVWSALRSGTAVDPVAPDRAASPCASGSASLRSTYANPVVWSGMPEACWASWNVASAESFGPEPVKASIACCEVETTSASADLREWESWSPLRIEPRLKPPLPDPPAALPAAERALFRASSTACGSEGWVTSVTDGSGEPGLTYTAVSPPSVPAMFPSAAPIGEAGRLRVGIGVVVRLKVDHGECARGDPVEERRAVRRRRGAVATEEAVQLEPARGRDSVAGRPDELPAARVRMPESRQELPRLRTVGVSVDKSVLLEPAGSRPGRWDRQRDATSRRSLRRPPPGCRRPPSTRRPAPTPEPADRKSRVSAEAQRASRDRTAASATPRQACRPRRSAARPRPPPGRERA